MCYGFLKRMNRNNVIDRFILLLELCGTIRKGKLEALEPQGSFGGEAQVHQR
jgi:hypothetical protein